MTTVFIFNVLISLWNTTEISSLFKILDSVVFISWQYAWPWTCYHWQRCWFKNTVLIFTELLHNPPNLWKKHDSWYFFKIILHLIHWLCFWWTIVVLKMVWIWSSIKQELSSERIKCIPKSGSLSTTDMRFTFKHPVTTTVLQYVLIKNSKGAALQYACCRTDLSMMSHRFVLQCMTSWFSVVLYRRFA